MYTNQSIYSTCIIHRMKFPAGSYHLEYISPEDGRKLTVKMMEKCVSLSFQKLA